MTGPFTFSDLDSRRFGVRVFRGFADDEAAARLAVGFDAEADVDLMIVRCHVDDVPVAQTLQAGGFVLTGTLMYYRGSTAAFAQAPERTDDIVVRRLAPDDLPALEELAREAFTDFGGHYHMDPRLDPAAATEGYVEWCVRTATEPTAEVFVADAGGEIAGFLAVLHHTPEETEFLLSAVASTFQRRGIYDTLIRTAGHRARERGVERIRLSTQLRNRGPQKVWSRCGLAPAEAYYTFHRWFR